MMPHQLNSHCGHYACLSNELAAKFKFTHFTRQRAKSLGRNNGDLKAWRASVPDKKTIFVAFAIEDECQRDLLKGQSLHPRAPYEFIDMSVKEPYDERWKDHVRTRIRRSHGVIALIGKNSLSSSGERWEIQCAKDEKKPLRGIWAYLDDRTQVEGVETYAWNDKNISDFIDSL